MSRLSALRCLVLLAALPAAAQKVPPAPVRWVTDAAGFLTEATRATLDRKLQDYQGQTGHQVLVWIDRSTGGVPIQDFGVRAFHAWGVGRKGVSDGLVIFLFTSDRSLRIEVGYGLEDKVPDAIASRIVRDEMTPRLAAGDRDGAVTAGVDAVLAAIGGAPPSAVQKSAAPPPPTGPYQQRRMPFWNSGCIVGVAILLFFGWILWLVFRSGGTRSSDGAGLGSSSSDSSGSSGGGSSGGGDFSGGGGDAGGGGADGSW
jgi:uncharacterized protein